MKYDGHIISLFNNELIVLLLLMIITLLTPAVFLTLELEILAFSILP
jgi:hypothetical protein